METREPVIRESLGHNDTREFWYSVDELQEYLDYVREKSREQGIETPGIRVYLGAYPKTPQSRGYATLFLAPTQESDERDENGELRNDNNYNIEPYNIIQGGWPPLNY